MIKPHLLIFSARLTMNLLQGCTFGMKKFLANRGAWLIVLLFSKDIDFSILELLAFYLMSSV